MPVHYGMTLALMSDRQICHVRLMHEKYTQYQDENDRFEAVKDGNCALYPKPMQIPDD